ncbi:MAG TPA: hypothetical protein VG838_09930 [Opitutaceae bacterium]|nr:hypothetical protein [Opitutaceae bacterium]
MNAPGTYVPSKLLAGETEVLRQHSFTRWMTRDLLQAATDFCRNLGLYPLYAETGTDGLARYLFWRLPAGASIEVRSGRAKEKFIDYDRVNEERDWRLLSLQVNEAEVYSAVWISAEHYDQGRRILAAYGITPAEKSAAS